jgi:hypothetical protein
MGWRLFTLIAGIVPATILVFFLVAMLSAGVAGFSQLEGASRAKAAGLILISLLGFVGYAALWLAALRPVLTRRIALGLLLGLLGIAAGVVMLLTEPEYLSSAFIPLFGGPGVVAGAQLFRFVARQRGQAAKKDPAGG